MDERQLAKLRLQELLGYPPETNSSRFDQPIGQYEFNTIRQKPSSAAVTNPNPAKSSPASPVEATPPPMAFDDPYGRAGQTKIPGLGGTTWSDLLRASEKIPEVVNQREALAQQKALLEHELNRKPQVDLSPAAAFLDSLYGTRISAGIKSPEDRTMLRAKLMQQIQGGQKDITEEQRRYIKDMLGLGESRRSATATTGDERLFKDFQKLAKTYQEVMDASKRAYDTLSSGGPIAENAVQVMIARASGEKGVLSDQDINRWQGSPDILSRAQRAAQKAFQGHKFTESDRDELYALAQVYSSRSMQDLEGLRDQMMGAAASYKASAPLFYQSTEGWLKPLRKREAEYAGKEETRKQSQGGDKVTVINPDGKKGKIPRSQLEAAKAQGYKLVE